MKRLFSPLAAWALRRCYRIGHVYRAPFGPLRGCRLCYDPTVQLHAMLGFWDVQVLQQLKPVLGSGILGADPLVADVGANIGLVTLWLQRVLPSAAIHAFEPGDHPCRLLRRNVEVNGRPAIIHQMAVSDLAGKTDFFIAGDHHQSSLLQSWASSTTPSTVVTVECTTLDAMFAAAGQALALIKMDIEGGGIRALKGCRECFSRHRTYLWIESHTPEEDAAIGQVALTYDYDAFRLSNRQWVRSKDTTWPDPDGMWGTLLLVPRELRSRLTPLLEGAR
ncbi:MAG: FkbM family methyltransferase [Candidatus Xenobia bacterium]